MKISDVVVTPVAFPDPPLLNSAGVHQPWALRQIVEIHAEGYVGLGETYGDLDLSAAAQLVGQDVFAALSLDGLKLRAVCETALLDLQGKALGRPVYDLLGGKVRDRIPFAGYLFYKWEGSDDYGPAVDPAGIVAQARLMVRRYGFGSLKLKGGVFPPDEEIAAIHALREAFPEHPLRLDPNCAWTVPTSLAVAERTAGLLEYLEDPTPGIAGMAEVAAAAPMPLATNMCVVSFADIPPAFARRAVGVVLADHHFWGGLRATQRLAGICETYGVGLSMHSNSHLGISLAAMVQVAAATPQLAYASDTHTPWQLGVDVVTAPLSIVDGAVAVPDGPGLGVELDRDALARMHEDYRHCGYRTRDDTAYMRTFQPDFEKRRPRW